MKMFNPNGKEVNVDKDQVATLLAAGWTRQKKVVEKAPEPVAKKAAPTAKPSGNKNRGE